MIALAAGLDHLKLDPALRAYVHLAHFHIHTSCHGSSFYLGGAEPTSSAAKTDADCPVASQRAPGAAPRRPRRRPPGATNCCAFRLPPSPWRGLNRAASSPLRRPIRTAGLSSRGDRPRRRCPSPGCPADQRVEQGVGHRPGLGMDGEGRERDRAGAVRHGPDERHLLAGCPSRT